MSRRAVDPMQKAAAAFRDLTTEQKDIFMLAVAMASTLEQIAPAPRKRKAKEVPQNAQ